MKRTLLTTIAILGSLCWAHTVSAQTAGLQSRLAWDQVASTTAEATGYTYRYYPDGGPTGFVSVATCVGTTSPFACSVAFPAFTPGTHTIQMTAANVAGESVKSAVFSFTFVVVPGVPTNLRIQ